MGPRTMESWQAQTRKGKEGFFTAALEGVQPCWHLDFRLPISRTTRE